ncbi:hypothetical protein AB1Y20_001314 [Prymnesium parvum]|uniref:PDZ domain-containing protein n=1 Tax=Prymnesium parvum TaxID=97485 RepID=A0AB34KD27_PRYPA
MAPRHSAPPTTERRDSRPGSAQRSRDASPPPPIVEVSARAPLPAPPLLSPKALRSVPQQQQHTPHTTPGSEPAEAGQWPSSACHLPTIRAHGQPTLTPQDMEVVPPPQGGEQHRNNTLSEDELLDGVEEDWNTAILGPSNEQGAQGEAMPPPPPRAPHELELEQAAATPVMNEAAPRLHIPSPTYTSSSATAEIHQIKSDGGYLQIFYSNTPRADKIALDEGMIIQAINTSIAQHKDESLFPMIESGSILIKDKWMCAQVTMSI